MSDEKLPTLKPEELIKAPKKMGLFLFQKIKREPLSIQASGWPKDNGSRSQINQRNETDQINNKTENARTNFYVSSTNP
jgi:hypothetical protein